MENIDVSSNEEITLFTDDEKVVLEEVNFEFEQSSKVWGFYNRLTVFNGSHCYQLIRNKHHPKIKFRINIAYLNPHPIRQHKVAWKWLIIAIPFFLVSLIMAYAGLFSATFEPSSNFMTVLTGLSLFSIICILLVIHRSYDKWIFSSEYGHVDLIELFNNYPDTVSFKLFIEQLTLQIKKTKQAKNKPLSEYLAEELRELRRLKDETVISKNQYETAKQLIFKHKGFSQNNTRP
jgi:hypothetical protein